MVRHDVLNVCEATPLVPLKRVHVRLLSEGRPHLVFLIRKPVCKLHSNSVFVIHVDFGRILVCIGVFLDGKTKADARFGSLDHVLRVLHILEQFLFTTKGLELVVRCNRNCDNFLLLFCERLEVLLHTSLNSIIVVVGDVRNHGAGLLGVGEAGLTEALIWRHVHGTHPVLPNIEGRVAVGLPAGRDMRALDRVALIFGGLDVLIDFVFGVDFIITEALFRNLKIALLLTLLFAYRDRGLRVVVSPHHEILQESVRGREVHGPGVGAPEPTFLIVQGGIDWVPPLFE